MAMLANIRTLPGLYGGGFARVVQVEAFPSGALGGAEQAAVRLEKLQDPLASFRQTLSQFDTAQTVSKPQQALDGNSLTLLQNVDPEKPLVTPFPPDLQQQIKQAQQNSTADDPSSYAIELARAEARRKEAQTEEQHQEERRAEALRQFEQSNNKQSDSSQQTQLTDQLDKLQKSLETLTGTTKISSLSYEQLDGVNTTTSTAAAAQAAQAYASTLATTA